MPTGTVTLLLADVEGSTRLWEAEPEAMTEAVARLDEVVAAVVRSHRGVRPVEQGEGDSFVVAFTRASDALAAALDLQRADTAPIRLRIGIHTGEVQLRDEANYIGPAINRTARLRNIAHGGQTVLSQAARDLVVDRLPEAASLADVGVHRLRDLARPERVYQLCHPDLAGEFPPLRSLDAYPHNLPVQLTSFVGRQAELNELRTLLAETRLLTLTGSGGSGKTRLALQLAADVLPDYPDGVWWVDLAPVGDPDLVPSVVARALGLREQADAIVDSLARHFDARSALVVLDNCEHLIGACAVLADKLLRSCSSLVFLATSREPLAVDGEITWRTPSLSLPRGAASSSEAVELFVERAKRSRPEFGLTDSNLDAVAEICRRLDGIPLALELAAARVRVLSPEQIASGLHDRFRILTGGARTATPRQQTLRASVEWSYNLLTEPERILFRRLAAFAGSFDYAAAETVGSGDGLEPHVVLDQLSLLVDKSLVASDDHAGKARYRLLETVRHYALEELEGAREADDVRRRHRDHYLGVLSDAAQRVVGPEQDVWLDVLVDELDNLRAAFDWSRTVGESEAAAVIAGLLQPFWFMRGYWGEGARWVDAALSGAREMSPAVHAAALALSGALTGQGNDPTAPARAEQALAMLGEIDDPGLRLVVLRSSATAFYIVDVHRAVALHRDAIDLARGLGDAVALAVGLQAFSVTQVLAGDLSGAAAAAEEALALATEAQSPYLIRWSRVVQGRVMIFRDPWRAREVLHKVAAEGLAVGDRTAFVSGQSNEADAAAVVGDTEHGRYLIDGVTTAVEEMDSPFHRCIVVMSRGLVGLAGGDPAGARDAFTSMWELLDGAAGIADLCLAPWAEAELALGEVAAARERAAGALERAEAGGFALQTCWALRACAHVAVADRDSERAGAMAHRCVTVAHEIEEHLALADALELCAHAAGSAGESVSGTRLFGAAGALREAVGYVRRAVDRDWYEASVSSTRDALGKEAFDKAWDEGAALSLDEAVAYATRGRGQRKRPATGWGSLTPAERDVARLVGEGLPNKDIAAKLFVSPRTVQAHLTHIYAKLDIASRVDLATEVIRRS